MKIILAITIALITTHVYAQNQSGMGNTPYVKSHRQEAVERCMKLSDDFERMKCVDSIK